MVKKYGGAAECVFANTRRPSSRSSAYATGDVATVHRVSDVDDRSARGCVRSRRAGAASNGATSVVDREHQQLSVCLSGPYTNTSVREPAAASIVVGPIAGVPVHVPGSLGNSPKLTEPGATG